MFQVKTVYSREDIKAFHKLVGGYVNKTRLLVSRYSFIIVGILLIIIGLTSFTASALLCLVCVVIGAGLLWPGVTFYDYLTKSTWKSWSRTNGNAPQVYTFNEDSIVEGNGDKTYTTPYSEVYGVYESEEHFFLFMSKKDGYIMRKTDFVEGEPAQFPAFIKEKTGRDMSKVTLQNIR